MNSSNCLFIDNEASIDMFRTHTLSNEVAFIHVVYNTNRRHDIHCFNNDLVYGIILKDITNDQIYWIDWLIYNQNAFIHDLIRKFQVIYTLDLSNSAKLDLDVVNLPFQLYHTTGEITDSAQLTPALFKRSENEFQNTDINLRIIPDIKHVEFIQNYLQCTEIPLSVNKNAHLISKFFYNIERNGIPINDEFFNSSFPKKKFLIDNQRVYTHYNLFTSTGRPSSRFGGINFAALNKDDDTRRFIQSDNLIEIDYNAYHPHLIADMIGYSFGDENVYEEIGKHLYHKQHINADEINQSKIKTFVQLYKGVSNDLVHVPFFAKVKEFVESLTNKSSINTFLNKRIIFPPGSSNEKKFNYIIQYAETSYNVNRLYPIIDKHESLKPILYTYDAILFEGTDISDSDKIAFTEGGKFPITIKQGPSYNNLHPIYNINISNERKY